jgi:HEAT repeat protein
MANALQIASLALAVAATAFVLVLVLRRLMLSREERERHAVEERLRDQALAIVDGDEVAMPDLARGQAAIFARMLARYSRQLSGEPREHIARYFEGGGHIDHQVELLRSRRAWKRASAAATLGDMASPQAIPALIDALDDPERDVRAAATRSLAVLGASVAVEPIVEALANGRVQRAVGGWALMQIGAPALTRLRGLLRHDDARVRASAAELIGLVGEASDAAELIGLLRDPSAEVRAKSAHALGRLGAGEAAAMLRGALGDRIFFVRAAAARALGQLDDEPSIPALVHQAQTDRFEAAQAAARALTALSPEGLSAMATLPTARAHLREAAGLAEVL